MSAMIEAVNLEKTYGTETVVDRVTFAVPAGEIFAYLGRNGSGKTTTVRMLTTLTSLTSGSGRVAGIDVVADPGAVKSKIGVTMQDAALDPQMDGREHLEFIAAILGHAGADIRKRADEMLELFGLTDAASKPIETYSGGMKRRLDIATALLGKPEVLFLDEPTTGLDPQSRRAMWAEIRTLKARGVTVFLTTQYLEEAELLADNVAILDNGKVIAQGTTAELKASHAHKHLTFSSSTSIEDFAATLVHRPGTTVTRDDVGQFVIDVPSNTPDRDLLGLANDLADRHGPLGDLNISSTSLEDVFLRLTGTSINETTEAALELQR